jgi:pimeloyl-ACP methyl ester carboxylesterase
MQAPFSESFLIIVIFSVVKNQHMKKLFFIGCLIHTIGLACMAQQKGISYGNNPVAAKYYSVRGIQLYTEQYGKGAPLLLIHGNGGSISAFSQTIPFFAAKYHVIAVDSRAHGKSTDTKDSLSFEMMADDFAALMDQMKLDSAYVIGWSDGGINALLLAMRHPNKVKKLASTGANLTADSLGLQPDSWLSDQQRYAREKDKMRSTDKEKNDWKIFMLDLVQPNIPFSALSAIHCPSLIICGDHDVIPIEHTTKIYQHIPKAYLWVIPHSGHATLIQHRDIFNAVVEEFFKKPYVQM